MNDPLTAVSTRRTPQSQPDPGVADRQKRNAAGGYVFRINDEVRIHRFLTLGTTGGTFYAGEARLTRDNAEVVLAAARERGEWLVEQVVAVSTAGRAPKQNPAIFALATVAGLGDEAARKAALAALPRVCRTGTHLFQFATYVEQFRGWGRGLVRAVGDWYLGRPVDDVAYQAVKYRQREGWSHRDLLRLAHPTPDSPERDALFKWVTSGELGPDVPALVGAFSEAQQSDIVPAALLDLIAQHPLSWEMLPDAARTPEVWRALVRKGMPQTALMRQLPTLTRLGVFDNAEITGIVVAQLQNADMLRKGRVHPVNVLVAARTYASGASVRGSSTWTPKRQIIDALDAAFYAAFGAVEPAGKATLIALDVSGSMGAPISGMPLTAREAAAALSLVTLATEPACDIVGFTASATAARDYRIGWGRVSRDQPVTELTISPRQRLDDVVSYTSRLDFGATDCAAPFRWASEQGRDYDTVIVYTDNETWAGPQHTHQALREYRRKVGHDVRMVVVGLTATDASIADPADPHSLDVAGFDSAVPNLIADFSRGEL